MGGCGDDNVDVETVAAGTPVQVNYDDDDDSCCHETTDLSCFCSCDGRRIARLLARQRPILVVDSTLSILNLTGIYVSF